MSYIIGKENVPKNQCRSNKSIQTNPQEQHTHTFAHSRSHILNRSAKCLAFLFRFCEKVKPMMGENLALKRFHLGAGFKKKDSFDIITVERYIYTVCAVPLEQLFSVNTINHFDVVRFLCSCYIFFSR